jgi:DNA-binding transcriptional ArsR family regulator
MPTTAKLASVAALLGDPARAAMMQAMMDGRALTASELARVAGITPQTASSHLARLTSAGLLAMEKQGRHRYHRLATPSMARLIESLMHVAAEIEPVRRPVVTGPRDLALRAARTCYDHLAGRLGVALADALVAAGHVELDSDAGIVTPAGLVLLERVGIDAMSAGRGRRVLCRPCLDWSERRPHLAGTLGAALCRLSFERGWVRRVEGTRAVSITPKGQRAFRETFGVRSE